MGVDFSLIVVKKERDKLIRIKDESVPDATIRSYHLCYLFCEERLNKLLDQPIDYSFYTKAFQVYDEKLRFDDVYFNPDAVLETVERVKKALENNQNKLPFYYWFEKHPDGPRDTHWSLFIGAKLCVLSGSYFTCELTWKGFLGREKSKDISNWKQISGKEVITEKIGDKWIHKKGEDVTYKVMKETYLERFSWILDKMIEVCSYAKKHGYLVTGYCW